MLLTTGAGCSVESTCWSGGVYASPRTGMRWELLDRFLRSDCTDAEHAEVLRWAAASPRHQQILDDLGRLLDVSSDGRSTQAEWERLRTGLVDDDPSE